ncbi:MAG: tRNA 2-selenouridine(34) synthase MnmH, partial [Venatoribacter sp.]
MNDSQDFKYLFLNDIPLLDTRAPIEFKKGAFAFAQNLPLMTDAERAKVGTCYKQHGQEAAIQLGHSLVSGAIKAQRVAAWAEFAKAHPEGYLYCFRGGLRSKISQQWLNEAGVPYPRIIGGYKAMRTFLLDTIEQAARECSYTVLSGLTGTGKTELLVQLPQGLDLEGIANHRGSSFGKHATAQPSQINFENNLAVELLKKREAGIKHFVLENEGKLVGSCNVPLSIQIRMRGAKVVVLEDDFDARVERILCDYVVKLRSEFVQQYGQTEGDTNYAARLQNSLKNIQKRLGGERYQRLAEILQEALTQQLEQQ